MAYHEIDYPTEKQAFYQLLCEQLNEYTDGAPNPMAALANASAVLCEAFREINWVGFYLVQGDRLVLGPFQGKPAVMAIDAGQGVCGAAWREKKTQVVADVHCFVGHIACDCSSVSEIVVPVFGKDHQVLGVIDIDSPLTGRFNEEDAAGLSLAAEIVAPLIAV
jgi:L-methionine (R)-S-oxide reductase